MVSARQHELLEPGTRTTERPNSLFSFARLGVFFRRDPSPKPDTRRPEFRELRDQYLPIAPRANSGLLPIHAEIVRSIFSTNCQCHVE